MNVRDLVPPEGECDTVSASRVMAGENSASASHASSDHARLRAMDQGDDFSMTVDWRLLISDTEIHAAKYEWLAARDGDI